jgi:hypothetical protein
MRIIGIDLPAGFEVNDAFPLVFMNETPFSMCVKSKYGMRNLS